MLFGAVVTFSIMFHAQNPPPRCMILIVKEKELKNFVNLDKNKLNFYTEVESKGKKLSRGDIIWQF